MVCVLCVPAQRGRGAGQAVSDPALQFVSSALPGHALLT